MADFDPDKYLAEKTGNAAVFDPDKYLAEKVGSPPKMGSGLAALISGESGALLGLRPVVAGAGAAAGAFSGTKGSFGDKLSAAKDAFMQGRSEANQEQNQASSDHPNIAMGANIGGSLLTLPLLPAKGLAGAVGLGAGLGAANAAGSANSLKEAGSDIAGGAALGGAGYGAIKAIGAGGKALINSDVGSAIGDKAKSLLMKVPSELTGISDKEIESYATRADKVNKIYKDAGGDPSLAAQHAKENILNDVTRTRQSLNSQIGHALANASPDPVIDATPIIQKLEQAKATIHPVYGENDIGSVDGLIEKIKQASTDGKLNVKDLQDTKNFLYDSAKGVYNQGGNIFPVGKEVAKAARGAGSIAKQIIDEVGPPEIKNANRQLMQLHEIEDHMGNNLLNPNAKSHGDIYAVGAGVQNNNSQALQKLGDMTGQDYLQGATDLAAARTFGNAPLLPSIKTGRSLIGPVIGGSLGGAAGGMVGGAPGAYMGAKVGAGIGAVLSSPAALKLSIDTGRISASAISSFGRALGVTPDNVGKLYQLLQSPDNQQLLMRIITEDNNQKAAASQNNGLGAIQRKATNIQ